VKVAGFDVTILAEEQIAAHDVGALGVPGMYPIPLHDRVVERIAERHARVFHYGEAQRSGGEVVETVTVVRAPGDVLA